MKKRILASFSIIVFAIACNDSSRQNKASAEKSVTDSSVYATYLQKGAGHAKAAGDALIKNLTGAINSRGMAYAIDFCNINARRITDSVAKKEVAGISRVTDKARNLKNLANTEELKIISKLQADLKKGSQPKPELVDNGEHFTGYYPIVTNALCMNCHGSKEKIELQTKEAIQLKYPQDAAFGYGVNQLRGLWKIVMTKR